MVSFKHGRPDRTNYRKFKIKSVTGQDDFASIAEVVRRRYTRVLKEGGATLKAKSSEPKPAEESTEASPASSLPDLILIDGGKGQLGMACAELEKLGLS